MSSKVYRVGQIVPSSNVTMETEIPAMLWARQNILPQERFTFHSSRMRMKKVTKEELAAMDAESDRCGRRCRRWKSSPPPPAQPTSCSGEWTSKPAPPKPARS